MARFSACAVLASSADAAAVLASLRSRKGKAGAAVSAYLELVGNRLVDGFDIAEPTALEMPDIVTYFVETEDPRGPFGAKEVGEGPIVCTLQAIANAVANAIGEPVKEMPITPVRVLRVLGRQAKQEAAAPARAPLPSRRVRSGR